MHRWGILGMTLLIGAASVGQTAPPSTAKPWYQRLFGSAEKPAATERPAPPKPIGPSPADQAAAMRATEEADYWRRVNVCNRLRDLAEQSGDEALLQRADELEQKAWDAYTQRTAHLPCSRQAPATATANRLGRSLDNASAAEKRLQPKPLILGDDGHVSASREGKP